MNQRAERERVERVWKAVRSHLEQARAHVNAEIGAYPPPITACDAQFNHLLDLRNHIAQELLRLDALSGLDGSPDDPAASMAAFIAASPCLDEPARQALRAALTEWAAG